MERHGNNQNRLRFEAGKQGFGGFGQAAAEHARGGAHLVILEQVNQFAQLIRVSGMADGTRKQRPLDITVGAYFDRQELGIGSQRIATEMAARKRERNDFCQALVAYRKT